MWLFPEPRRPNWIVLPTFGAECDQDDMWKQSVNWRYIWPSFSFLSVQRTFHYDSILWTDKREHHPSSGNTLFDHQETKLPTYWSTPFSKVCLAMNIGGQVKSIVIHKYANSLYSLIADGKYRPTSLGRNTWKRLIGEQASLQTNCNQEGFNSVTSSSKARIGIIGNNENDCKTCDSRIGFGTAGQHDDSNTCGNEAMYGGDNGNKHIKAMGYILVKWVSKNLVPVHAPLNDQWICNAYRKL